MGCSSSAPSGSAQVKLALQQELELERAKLSKAQQARRASSAERSQTLHEKDEWYTIYRDVTSALEAAVSDVEARDMEQQACQTAEDTLLELQTEHIIATVMHEALIDDYSQSLASTAMMAAMEDVYHETRRRHVAEQDEETRVVVAAALDFMSDLVARTVQAQHSKDENDRMQREEAEIARVKQGWLRKRGHVRKNWKWRWFVLDRGILRYYVDPLDVPPYGANLRGEINLEGYSVVQSEASPTQFELFSLSEEHGRQLERQHSGGGSRGAVLLRSLSLGSRSSVKKTASTLVEAEDTASALAWVHALRRQQTLFFRPDTAFSEVDDYDTVFAEGPLERRGFLSRSWVERWFVLKIHKIEYFEDHTLQAKKGEFLLHAHECQVQPRDGIQRKRFCVVNGENDALELAAFTDAERQNWVTMIMRVCCREFGEDYSRRYDLFSESLRQSEQEGADEDDGGRDRCDLDEVAAEVLFDDYEEQEVQRLREEVHRQVSALAFSDSDSEGSLSCDELEEHEQRHHEPKSNENEQEMLQLHSKSPVDDTVTCTALQPSSNIADSRDNAISVDQSAAMSRVSVESPARNSSAEVQPPRPTQQQAVHPCSVMEWRTQPTDKPDGYGDVDTQSETIALLRKQLLDKGEVPLEFIPLDKLRQEIADLVQKASQGLEHDEGRLDFCLKCLESNPQHRAEQEQLRLNWLAEITPYAVECLRIQRSFIPSHIFHSSVTSLVDNDDVRTVLAKRFLMKKCLWLVRVSHEDISKMHIVELSGRFNPEAQGLDIVEVAAIYISLPTTFQNDHDGKKARWKSNVEAHFQSMYRKKAANSLPPNLLRHSAYKQQKPLFGEDYQMHKFGEVLKNSDESKDEFILKSKAKNIGRRSSIAADQASLRVPSFSSAASAADNEIFQSRRKGRGDLSATRQEFGKELNKSLRRASVASVSDLKTQPLGAAQPPSFLDAIKARQEHKLSAGTYSRR